MQWFWDAVDWCENLHWYQAFALSFGLFLVGVFGSLVIVSWMVVRLPANYFRKEHSPAFWADRSPIVRGVGIIVKNLLGLLLIVIGVILSLPGVPGQGVLTILIGLILVDFPGKRWLERWIVSRKLVFRTLNRLRARRNQPPLELDEPSRP